MSLKQFKLENAAGTTTPITNSNRALIGAALVSLGSNGTPSQNWTDSGHEVTCSSFVTGSPNANAARWNADASDDLFAWDFIATYRGAGTNQAFTATGVLFQGRSTTSDSSGKWPWKARFPLSGNMAWQDFAGATIPLASGAHAPAANVEFRYSIVANRASGTITIKAYTLAGVLQATWSKTGADLGLDPFLGIEEDAASNQVGTTKIRRLQMNNGASSEIGPWVDAANQAPTASYDSVRSSVTAGATFTAVLSGSDPDGTIAGYEHALDSSSVPGVSINGATQAQASGIAPAAGNLLVLRGRVRDDQNVNSPWVYKEIVIPTSDNIVYPLPTVLGGYVRNGVQTTDGDTLASASDDDFMETPSPLSSTAQTLDARFRPMVTRSGTLAHTVRLSRAGTSGHAVVRLMQGSNVLATLPSFAVSDTPTTYQIDLTASQVDAITAAIAAGAWSTLHVQVDFLI